jgi:hypothetical protein
MDIVAYYRCLQMPRYIWVVELADQGELEGKSPYSRKIRGEILLDATANRHAPDEALLSFQYDGRLYIPGRFENASLYFTVEDAKPYRPLLRATQSSI